MDFDILAKRVDVNAQENGAWLHLRDPHDGEPMYADPGTNARPCRALVRSRLSSYFRNADIKMTAQNQSKLARTKLPNREAMTEENLAKARPRWFATVLVALENCSSAKPGTVHMDEATSLEVANDPKYAWLLEQVIEFAFDDTNFGGGTENPQDAAPRGKTSKS